MTAHLKPLTSSHQQSGVTLIELVLSMVIISVALVGILSVMNLTVAHSADPMVEQQALAVAEAYLEEIALQAYSGGTSIGGRANFDEVDDYNGLSDSGNNSGNPISGLNGYNASVAVSSEMTLNGNVKAKQITVSVSAPGIATVSLIGYKMDY